MSRRALLVLLAVLAAGVVLYIWQVALVSEEDRVREVLYDITDAFNDQRAGGVCAGIAERVRVNGATRRRDAEIKPGLIHIFLRQQRDAGARYRVELAEIEVAPIYESDNQTRADVTVSYRLAERQGQDWGEAQEFSAQLQLVKHDPDGWQVVEVEVEGGDRLPYER